MKNKLLHGYDFPDKEAEESALVGGLDIMSSDYLKKAIKMTYDWISYRENNYFDITSFESMIRILYID